MASNPPYSCSRRSFLRAAGLGAGALAIAGRAGGAAWLAAGRSLLQPDERAGDAWAQAAAILRRITPPHIPARDFDVRRFGAVADGIFDCTPAFKSAVSACVAAGGGRIVVPAGRFATRPIRLASGVNLSLPSR